MCGIAGRIELGSGIVSSEALNLMSNRIAHRGPDDDGVYISPNRRVGLVHRRLAIIDLSSAGHQPMNYLKRYWIVFNGEIYNFGELRSKLIHQGYKFESNSDTEVILALYDKWGRKCLTHLRGMFALAIYDSKKSELFLARDRMGKKPLKYYLDDKVFLFASELKSLLTQPEVKRDPDWLAIHHYLSFGYCPSPMTGFSKIKKLEPGHYMVVNLITQKITKKRYWALDFSQKLDLSQTEWEQRILETLEESVKLRMISDVPLGAFLSGGVDSSAIVALMAKNSSKPVNTFTIGFFEKEYNETKFAQTIAAKYKTNHTVLMAKPNSVESLPGLVAHYEEPFADSSIVITHMVSKLARARVKVVLNGDGSDESFGGYLRHVKLQRDLWLSRNPWVVSLGRPLSRAWNRADRFIKNQNVDIRLRYMSYNSYFNREEKRQLYVKDFVPLTYDNSSNQLWLDKCQEAGEIDVRDQLTYADLNYYFADSQLTKVDLASMKVGLEARSPFADHKFMELVAQIPFDLKVRRGETKYILKKSLEKLVPLQNLYRKKVGFSVPLSYWFENKLRSYTLARLSRKNSILGHLFQKEGVEKMLKEHSRTNDYGPKLWSLLTLQLWWDRYFS